MKPTKTVNNRIQIFIFTFVGVKSLSTGGVEPVLSKGLCLWKAAVYAEPSR